MASASAATARVPAALPPAVAFVSAGRASLNTLPPGTGLSEPAAPR